MVKLQLFVAALLIGTSAEAKWYEASSDHFVVYADENPDQLRAYVEKLERFDQAMRAMRLIPNKKEGPASRVTIYRFGDVEDVRKLHGRGRSVAGFYIPRAEGSVAFVPRSANSITISSNYILFHEYAHDFMLRNWTGAAFPAWFVEGFAEFHATAQFRSDGSIVFGAPPTHRSYNIGNAAGLPLKELLSARASDLQGDRQDTLYGRGWLLTHYLTFEPERRRQLAAYIGAVNSGKSSDEAAATLDGVTDAALNAYGRRPRLNSIQIRPDQIKMGPIKVRALSDGEAATMPARIRSQRGVDESKAREVVALARQLAAPFPTDAAAQAGLAEAEFDAGNYKAAEAAALRATTADPESVAGLVYLGKARIALVEADKTKDAKVWASARAPLLRANKIDSEDPEPLIEFYDSFAAAGQSPTANARDALLYAYALAPHDFGLRMKAGIVLLEMDKPAAARTALTPLIYTLDRGENAISMASVLQTLAAEGSSAALKKLRDAQSEAKKKAEEDGSDGR